MKKLLAFVLMMLLLGILFISTAYAEMTFDYGAAERIRQEYWANLLDLKTLPSNPTNFDRDFFRFKTSFWGSANFNKDTSVYLKLTSEIYYNMGPYRQPPHEQLDENEGVFDNFYVKADNLFGLPIDLKVGRQDFLGPDMYGEGFLLSDGTPNDGSRTYYFNAARARWRINNNHMVDLVYIVDQFQDKFLPTWRTDVPDKGTYFNDKKILNASDEQAYMIYVRSKLNENLSVEPYYIFKKEKEHQLAPFTPELDLNTIGARAVYKSGPWTLGGEFAHQFGEFDNGKDRSAYGGYIFGIIS